MARAFFKLVQRRRRSCTNSPAPKEDQFSAGGPAAEEGTFGFYLQDCEDSNPTEGGEGRRSLADYHDPPFVSKAHPPEEIGDVDGLGSATLVQIYPPHVVEGFPSSETFFYLRLQETGNNMRSGPFASLPGGQLSNTTTTPLFILMFTLCGILYLLIKKCDCFMKCGWKGSHSNNGSAIGNTDTV